MTGWNSKLLLLVVQMEALSSQAKHFQLYEKKLYYNYIHFYIINKGE